MLWSFPMAVPQECPVGSLPSPSCSPGEDHQFPGVWFAGSLKSLHPSSFSRSLPATQNLNARLRPAPLLSLLAMEVGPYWIPTMRVVEVSPCSEEAMIFSQVYVSNPNKRSQEM